MFATVLAMVWITELVAFLQGPAFTMASVPVSWAEILGDVTGAACVWLVARQHVLNWPLGLLNNAFWALLFWEAMLYADALLQVLFFALGVYGWWNWGRRGTALRGPLNVRRSAPRELAALACFAVFLTLAGTWLLSRHTRSPAPFWDASVLALSLAATYGQAQKLIESWWMWIAVDVISVPLYASRALYPTALLYVLFGGLCVQGLMSWQRDLNASEVSP